MKPHLKKTKGLWTCDSRYYGLLGHAHLAWGVGKTPSEAYFQWSLHRGASV